MRTVDGIIMIRCMDLYVRTYRSFRTYLDTKLLGVSYHGDTHELLKQDSIIIFTCFDEITNAIENKEPFYDLFGRSHDVISSFSTAP